MGHRHGLRGLGANRQARVTIDDPRLVGAHGLLCGSAVLVEDAEQTIDADTAKGDFVGGTTGVARDNVDALVLGPHRRNPRLADVRHQRTDGTRGIVVVCGIHPSLGEAVAAVVVLTHKTGHREDKRQLVLVGQGVDVRDGIIDIAGAVGAPSRLLTMVGVVDDAHATVDVGRNGGRRAIITCEICITLIHGRIAIVQQVGTDVVHVLVVILVVMARTAFFSRDALADLQPGGRSGEVALVGDGTVALGGHTGGGAGGETADDDIVVNVATSHLTVGVVAQAAIARTTA